ncbi:hypothetical protein [Knoellia koreensis]|uniref:DUF4345 domain-containing protein n=1 Tax=Knoellia koreensis TaxID=2730921 RepID=A0A849HG05_9MICO|nr:hypothetical protein [Knoellia sp. DB2414S]NNM46192.1 hypothetical protein [Knoellia sp. DB2414S]
MTEKPVRRLGWVFAVLALLTAPWVVFLAIRLPSDRAATHYDLAWAGFDLGLVAALAATSYAALRVGAWLPVAAAVTGTMLVVDAWFDVVTAPTPDERWIALAMAALVELPLAGVCLWLAVTGQHLLRRGLGRSAAVAGEAPVRPTRQ